MSINVENKVCIVTGGNKGIGRGIVEKFANNGATVVFALGRDEAALREVEKVSSNIRGIKLDVTNEEGVKEFVAKVVEEFGKIDILVNNAGVTKDKLIQRMTSEDWDFVININLKGVFTLTKCIVPTMLKNGVGSIVNMSSVVGLDGNIGQSNYAAAKGGVIAMTKGWAKEFSRKGAQIRVNAIAPGFTQTEMLAHVPEKVLDAISQKVMLKKLGDVEDIANACLFLASDASKYITAQTLRVDGGMIFGI